MTPMKEEKFNPIDDVMFTKMAEEPRFCEEIIRVILGKPELCVVEVRPQDQVTNLKGRSVRLDVLCRLADGTLVNVEVQKYSDEDHEKRVRYYGSVLTAEHTPKGVIVCGCGKCLCNLHCEVRHLRGRALGLSCG